MNGITKKLLRTLGALVLASFSMLVMVLPMVPGALGSNQNNFWIQVLVPPAIFLLVLLVKIWCVREREESASDSAAKGAPPREGQSPKLWVGVLLYVVPVGVALGFYPDRVAENWVLVTILAGVAVGIIALSLLWSWTWRG